MRARSSPARGITLRYRVRRAWLELTGQSRQIYEAAEAHRLLADWITSLNTTDDEVRWGIDRLRSRARDLERNNSTTRNYLRLTAVNVIGPSGMRLQSQIRGADGRLDKTRNGRVEAGWKEWGRSPTKDGRGSLASFQRLILKTVCRDGEAFVRLWRGYEGNRFRFALEGVDADRLDAGFSRAASRGVNEIRMSVEVDADNRPVAYWIRRDRPGQPQERERISADQIIHLYDPDRVNQSRGVTWMTSIMLPVRQLGGYIESELVAARIGAAKMGFFQRIKDATMGPGGLDPGQGTFTTEANPGTFGVVPDGYEVSSFNPDHPAAAFGTFLTEAKRDIATGVGVAHSSLSGNLTEVNYSSIRAGLLVERDVWKVLQEWWLDAFVWPVYGEWLNMALLAGAVDVGASRDYRQFLTARWAPRGWAWVDPAKEVGATLEGISGGLISRTIALAERGLDVEDVFEQLAEEKDLAEQYGIDVTPRATPGPKPAAEPADESGAGDEPTPGRNGTGHPRRALAARGRF
jgi:lambda family phage portal protein